MTDRTASTFAGLYLCLLVALGGATTQGQPADALLQLLALPIALLALARLLNTPLTALHQAALLITALLFAWTALQLLPLPPALWQSLGARDTISIDLAAAGIAPGWRPISLDPHATLRALFALLPPIALGLLALTLRTAQLQSLLQLVLLLAVLSAVLGLAQLAGGADSSLRWHAVTNATSAVGPFANRNHLATLLVLALPLSTAMLLAALRDRSRHHANTIPWRIALAVMAAIILLLAIAITRSRSGVILGAVGVLGCALLVWRQYRGNQDHRSSTRTARRWLMGAVLAGLVLAVQFGFYGLLQRFEADPLDDLRFTLSATTLDAAISHGSLGAGAGTFVAAYAAAQPPEQRLSVYINRAHNDWLEWALEGGIPLLLLVLAGVVILAAASRHAWTKRASIANPSAVIGSRAAAIAVLMLLLHSLTDYPLRTTTLSAVFALLCAIIFKSVLRAPTRATSERTSTP